MTNNSKPIRNSFTLDDKLDAVFFIDRVELVKSQEESLSFPVFETVGEYIDFYRRLVGRRIVARDSLINKSKEQAVEDEIQHLQQTIAPLVDRSPRTDRSETRFCDIVPVKDQRKVWTNIFTDFPGLLHWKG
ncbi:MAG: hypothetical protein LBL39_06650, partial [Planctomycetaceae bacterium]|nr:hypothetical protein [Planctomycetaceae bacterium]